MGLFKKKKKSSKIPLLPMPPSPDSEIIPQKTSQNIQTPSLEQYKGVVRDLDNKIKQEKLAMKRGQENKQQSLALRKTDTNKIQQPEQPIKVDTTKGSETTKEIQMSKQPQPKRLQSIEEEMGLQPVQKPIKEHETIKQTTKESFTNELGVRTQAITTPTTSEEKQATEKEGGVGLSQNQTITTPTIPKGPERVEQEYKPNNIELPEIETSAVLGGEAKKPSVNYLFLKYDTFIDFVKNLKQVRMYSSQLSGSVDGMLINIDAQALKLKKIQKVMNLSNNKLLKIDSEIFGISKNQQA